jgi:hypothetical protein
VVHVKKLIQVKNKKYGSDRIENAKRKKQPWQSHAAESKMSTDALGKKTCIQSAEF